MAIAIWVIEFRNSAKAKINSASEGLIQHGRPFGATSRCLSLASIPCTTRLRPEQANELDEHKHPSTSQRAPFLSRGVKTRPCPARGTCELAHPSRLIHSKALEQLGRDKDDGRARIRKRQEARKKRNPATRCNQEARTM